MAGKSKLPPIAFRAMIADLENINVKEVANRYGLSLNHTYEVWNEWRTFLRLKRKFFGDEDV